MERLSACETAEKLRVGGLTVEELSRSLLKRIQDRSDISAWVHLDKDQVLKAAQRLDDVPKDQRGPLFGVPIGIKDLFYTSGVVESSGTQARRS
jgi:Asp-tRNA(Asn)/Glu-tRNA(Gln) amidotransferase A subunit family amidase